MKLLITGANGQLGTELRRCLKHGRSELGPLPEKLLHATVIGTDIAGADTEPLDITDRHEVAVFLRRHQPDAVINCGAFTNVDGCEAQREAAFKVNALGPRNLALACAEIGAKLLHVSTDYVFRGEGERPFCEYDAPDPQSMYGRTKLLGEEYVREFCPKYFIVRTAWLYGYAGKNFVKTMVRLTQGAGAAVVNDQVGNPTNAADLAHHLLKLCVTKEYGVYHCTGEGICSWYDFANEIARLAGKEGAITPCTSKEYAARHPESANRPAYSALENAMLKATAGDEMRGWKEALACFFKNWDGN